MSTHDGYTNAVMKPPEENLSRRRPEVTPPLTGENLPQSVWQGEFTIFGVTLHCHVLSDGKRIIEADDLAALFEGRASGPTDQAELERFARWRIERP